MINTDIIIAMAFNIRGGIAGEKIRPKSPRLIRIPIPIAKNSQTASYMESPPAEI
jgi:hypothetical protein